MSADERSVTDTLRRMLLGGEFGGEPRITESLIARRLSCSRTPVRGALRTLSFEGLLAKRDGRGYDIVSQDVAPFEEALALRAALEGLAARAAAEQGLSGAPAARMEGALLAMEAALKRDDVTPMVAAAFDLADAIFHRAIVDAGRNGALEFAFSRLTALPGFRRQGGDRAGKDWDLPMLALACAQHRGVYEAIASGKPAQAEARMREHINGIADYAPDVSLARARPTATENRPETTTQ